MTVDLSGLITSATPPPRRLRAWDDAESSGAMSWQVVAHLTCLAENPLQVPHPAMDRGKPRWRPGALVKIWAFRWVFVMLKVLFIRGNLHLFDV